MQENFYDTQVPKKSINLSINSDLLLEEKSREWREENHEAIEAYNRRIEASGVFSEGLRRF